MPGKPSRLSLTRETIRSLTDRELAHVPGAQPMPWELASQRWSFCETCVNCHEHSVNGWSCPGGGTCACTAE